ncbi:MAG: nuclear transport factor 2 family protein [Bradyrhizobium sp.]|uniref:nuclear transport factor 2 family protein n=1 Tax=Bradyrhizobium sp. TaxID=376 RepID=UPI002A303A7A|nr:nuclear transport factor 2 family protein [Bradyrhizobium sp.]
MPTQAASDDAEATIRELRSRSNAAIARHDVAAAVAIMRDDVRIIASSGELFDGAAAMAKAFDRSFSDPAFVTYVRGPQSIEVSDAAAVEIGRWEGRWKTRLVRGAYMARWQHEQIGWRIAAELFVPLAIDEQPAAGAP